jgi:hypothetical protein
LALGEVVRQRAQAALDAGCLVQRPDRVADLVDLRSGERAAGVVGELGGQLVVAQRPPRAAEVGHDPFGQLPSGGGDAGQDGGELMREHLGAGGLGDDVDLRHQCPAGRVTGQLVGEIGEPDAETVPAE